MVSRLDRLFILLDTGSNESIRLAAARQLGEVQRVQPDDLNYLLQRIKDYSYKSIWETRVAAGQAIRCVLEHVEPWPAKHIELNHDIQLTDDKIKCRQDIADNLTREIDFSQLFQQFDINKIILQCPKLLSLNGIDADETFDGNNKLVAGKSGRTQAKKALARKADKEQLLRQRKLINKELGISMVDSLNLGVKSTDIVTNDDLQTPDYDNKSAFTAPNDVQTSTSQQDTYAIVLSYSSNYDKMLNELLNNNCIYQEQSTKQDHKETYSSSLDSPVTSLKFDWPLRDITKGYANDLFNPSWEIRHGAAIALREIVRCQGKSAGRRSELSCSSNDNLNQLWLIDMAFRAISVLALDKFGDFLFDQVVAPVRENAAQLLGCCVANMSKEIAHLTIQLMLRMLENKAWETRHGGILGIKYSLNIVEESFSRRLLQECFEPIYKCLGDTVDDVSAEAAASLVPVKDLMIEEIPDKAPKLVKFLWEHLADLDELTTSTSNIVLLLASLITSSPAQLETTELVKSIPRLWSLLGHSSTTVRISVLKALLTLIKPQRLTCLSWMPEELLSSALRLIFQRSILENMDEVRPHIEEVWLNLIKIDENSQNSQVERFNLLKSISQYLNYWLCLILQPSNAPIDRSSPMWLNIKPDGTKSEIKPDGEVYIVSSTFNVETIDQQKHQVTKCRLSSTKLLGSLYANLVNDLRVFPESQHSKDALKYLGDMFVHYMKTKSANQRLISGWAIESWASRQALLFERDYVKLQSLLPQNLVEQMDSALQESSLCYDELASTFTRLQQETRDFLTSLKSANITLDFHNLKEPARAIYNLKQIQTLCDLNIEVELNRVYSKRDNSNSSKEKTIDDSNKSEIYTNLAGKKSILTKSLKTTQQLQKSLSTSVLSSLACAHVSWRLLPKKLDLIINPLMDSIELEEEQCLQIKSIEYLVILIEHLLQDQNSDNFQLMNNILDRLIDVLSCKTVAMMFDPNFDSCKIILLDNLQRKAEMGKALSRRQSSINSTIGLKRSHSITTSQDLLDNGDDTSLKATQQQQRELDNLFEIKMRGSSAALRKLTEHFGDKLPYTLGNIWQRITDGIKIQVNTRRICLENHHRTQDETDLIRSLRLLEVVGDCIHVDLRKNMLQPFEYLVELLGSSNPFIRHHSAQCIGVISKLMFNEAIDLITSKILPSLGDSVKTLPRCGAIEAVALIIEHLQLDLVPKIDMFIIQVLGRMSDQNDQVRLMATHCFGKLLSLMPLNLEKKSSSTQAESDVEKNSSNDHDNQRFIEQLLNPKKLDNFKVPFKIEAQLRSYQQNGLDWLAFLNRFNLHGILCDEMGLGKTLMTICMVAADHLNQKEGLHRQQAPSLIVCPSTLTEHWLYEIDKFLPEQVSKALNAVSYSGSLSDRMSLRGRIGYKEIMPNCTDDSMTGSMGYEQIMSTSTAPDNSTENQKRDINLVIASYDIVRIDIDFFKECHWNYCVLDEGHIIKNSKRKLSRAIRLLNGKHRLILSGTPIQNNVTELWSLFDFLMPGFLGSERQFNARYTKPILQSRELKCSPRELEAGALAMESLHRQVLPFILRRLKEEVLEDLPPKIIQDYYCELSSLQHQLYEDFTRSKLCNEVTKKSIQSLNNDDVNNQDENSVQKVTKSKSNVFQALQYLKNVCNHPKLVLTHKHSKYCDIEKSIRAEKSSLDDIKYSTKLKALKQLLIDCGIGVNDANEEFNQQQQASELESVVNQHRALIFCQVRSMVTIIENDLLKKHLPSVTYLRLDGSIPVNQRQAIVSRFNNDPSIDILLLTTQIGGLGLNLTGADTVIFVEHDWNPTKDLQAMDRAHRIGQKKVVNVYRLITKGTLEEKIMGLQKFKTMVSNTVINQDNGGLGTMNVDQLLDLFEDSGNSLDRNCSSSTSRNRPPGSGGGKSFMDLLPELWDQQQYETEYDLGNFVSSLRN